MEAAKKAIAAAIATREISDHGLGEPIPGKNCEYRTDVPVTNPTFNVDEVATAMLYLVTGPVKVLRTLPRHAGTSYGWKHHAERWGEMVGLSPYVSNGAFIVAAEWLGVPSRRHHNSPNISYALKLLRSRDDDALWLTYEAPRFRPNFTTVTL